MHQLAGLLSRSCYLRVWYKLVLRRFQTNYELLSGYILELCHKNLVSPKLFIKLQVQLCHRRRLLFSRQQAQIQNSMGHHQAISITQNGIKKMSSVPRRKITYPKRTEEKHFE